MSVHSSLPIPGARLFGILVGCVLLAAGTAQSTASTVQLPIWCDSYVVLNQGSHCGDPTISVRNDGVEANAYLTFNVSAIRTSSQVTSDPWLNLYVTDVAGAPLTLLVDAVAASEPLCDCCVSWPGPDAEPWTYAPILGTGSYGIAIPRARIIQAVDAGEVTVTFELRAYSGSLTLASNENSQATHGPNLQFDLSGAPRAFRVDVDCAVPGPAMSSTLECLDTALDRFSIWCSDVPPITVRFQQGSPPCAPLGGFPTADPAVVLEYSNISALAGANLQWITAHELTHLLYRTLSRTTQWGGEGLADWGATAVWHSEWGEAGNPIPFGDQFLDYLQCLVGSGITCAGSCSDSEWRDLDPRVDYPCVEPDGCCCWQRGASEDYWVHLLGLDAANFQRLDALSAPCPRDLVADDASIQAWKGETPTRPSTWGSIKAMYREQTR